MRRIVISVAAGFGLCLLASVTSAQPPRPATPPQTVAPGDEIKLDESSSLKAIAIESRMAALRANFQLMLRQVQDLQNEYNKALEERKKVLDDSAKRGRVEVREPNDWVYDESGHRYVRVKKP